MATTKELQSDLEELQKTFQQLREEVERIIVGHESVVEDVLIALVIGEHVLLEGVPGLGKTLLVRTLSQVADISFGRIQFTPDRRRPAVYASEGASLRQHRAGGRDQSRHPENTVRPARSDAGTVGDDRGRDAQIDRALSRSRHPESP